MVLDTLLSFLELSADAPEGASHSFHSSSKSQQDTGFVWDDAPLGATWRHNPIRLMLMAKAQEDDAMPEDGAVRQAGTPAQLRNQAQKIVLLNTYRYLFPGKQDPCDGELSTMLTAYTRQGEGRESAKVLDQWFTSFDADGGAGVRTPRAWLLQCVANGTGEARRPTRQTRRPRKAGTAPERADDSDTAPEPPRAPAPQEPQETPAEREARRQVNEDLERQYREFRRQENEEAEKRRAADRQERERIRNETPEDRMRRKLGL
jgi:hypothetical protein